MSSRRFGFPSIWSACFVLAVLLRFAPAVCHAQGTLEVPRKSYIASFGLSDEQKVFRYEAAQAARVLHAYYSYGGESVVRPNKQHPKIPTGSVVSHTLLEVASRMDRREDVLVVFLTSHGSERGLALSERNQGSLLTPGQLAAFLHQTGVHHKVVIVSACHSGIFLSLANSGTLVITASDAASSSFGCDDSRNMTYFGDSFINKAVPATTSLSEAFRRARSIVAGLERRDCSEGKLTAAQYQKLVADGDCNPPSNPQMAGGGVFADKLRAAHVDAAAKRQLRLDVF